MKVTSHPRGKNRIFHPGKNCTHFFLLQRRTENRTIEREREKQSERKLTSGRDEKEINDKEGNDGKRGRRNRRAEILTSLLECVCLSFWVLEPLTELRTQKRSWRELRIFFLNFQSTLPFSLSLSLSLILPIPHFLW